LKFERKQANQYIVSGIEILFLKKGELNLTFRQINESTFKHLYIYMLNALYTPKTQS